MEIWTRRYSQVLEQFRCIGTQSLLKYAVECRDFLSVVSSLEV